MLSVEKCRELLNDETLTDEEVLKIRESLYGMAELILDFYFEDNKRKKTPRKVALFVDIDRSIF